MIAYIAIINDQYTNTILALSLNKDKAMKIVSEYLLESGMDQWMDRGDGQKAFSAGQLPAEALYTKRDFSEDVWVIAREIDE
jgi:hypothetical protein